jgi:hypothetical protein
MAGLDPAIHLLEKSLAKMMDARVKPAHGESISLRPRLSGAPRREVRRGSRCIRGTQSLTN